MRMDKLTSKFQLALADAQSLAVGLDNQLIEPEHVMVALLDHLHIEHCGVLGFLSGGADSYIDYSVGVTWSVVGVDLGLAWVGTDLDDEDVFDTSWGDDTAVFSISKSF